MKEQAFINITSILKRWKLRPHTVNQLIFSHTETKWWSHLKVSGFLIHEDTRVQTRFHPMCGCAEQTGAIHSQATSSIVRALDFQLMELDSNCFTLSGSHPASWRADKPQGCPVLDHRGQVSRDVCRASIVSPESWVLTLWGLGAAQFLRREDQPTNGLVGTSSGQWVQLPATSIFWAV